MEATRKESQSSLRPYRFIRYKRRRTGFYTRIAGELRDEGYFGTEGEDLRRRRGHRRHPGTEPQAVHQGIHDQSDADEKGGSGGLRGVRGGGAAADPGPPGVV